MKITRRQLKRIIKEELNNTHLLQEENGLKPDGPNIPWKTGGKEGCIALKVDGGNTWVILQVGGDCEGKEAGGESKPIKIESAKAKEVVADLKTDAQSAVEKNWKWLNHYSGHMLGPHK
jgi:hypothetical protein